MLRDKKFWIGVVISIVCLYLAFRDEDFAEIGRALGRVQYWAILPALLAYFVGVWVRAVRWKVLLSSVRKDISSYSLFRVLCIGYMGNDILPARLGDVLRVYVVSRRENVTKSASLATILVERILDGLTMLGFLAVSALFITLNREMENALRVFSIVFLAGLLVFVALAASPERITTLVQLLLGRSPLGRVIPEALHNRALHITAAFVNGLGVLRSWQGVVSVMGLSVAAWACETAMYYIIGSWGFGLKLPIHAYTMTTAAANLSTLVPSSPGFIGVFDGVAKSVLIALFNVDSSLALSYVVVLHAALLFPVTALGLFYMARESVSWRDLGAMEDKEARGQPGLTDDDDSDPGAPALAAQAGTQEQNPTREAAAPRR